MTAPDFVTLSFEGKKIENIVLMPEDMEWTPIAANNHSGFVSKSKCP